MTVALVLPDRIVSDSRMPGPPHFTVGKIFRHPCGGLFVTAGNTRLTYPFEKAMQAGKDPEPMEMLEDESFEAALLLPDSRIVLYDDNFTPAYISEPWTTIGSGGEIARSWYTNRMRYGLAPEDCLERVFEVRDDCGPPIVTVTLERQARRARARK